MGRIKTESIDLLRENAAELGVKLEYSDDISVLSLPLTIEKTVIPNRILIQPVECADAEPDGAPGELTERRYLRFAEGGAGCIWFEAVALCPELKSNPRQLVLSHETLGGFQRLISDMKEAAVKQNGKSPAVVLQMSHPGRSCDPVSKPASDNKVWEKIRSAKGQLSVSDDEIDKLADTYGEITHLADLAGFDGVEVKACHMFFISELISVRSRKGRYGRSYENRVRHLKEAISASRSESGGMFLTVRMNFYDGIPYPDGFGMKEGGGFSPDNTEPLKLIAEIKSEFGVELINCSSGDPNFSAFPELAQMNRDPLFSPPAHPIKTGARMHLFASEIKSAIPETKVVATGFSHLYHHAPGIGAGIIKRKDADLIGFGRQALAYPGFARDILFNGKMDPEKVCVCCGGCGKLISERKKGGCVVRDTVYKNSKSIKI